MLPHHILYLAMGEKSLALVLMGRPFGDLLSKPLAECLSVQCIRSMMSLLLLSRYEGFVLEIWIQAAIELRLLDEETAQSQVRQELVKFIARLGNMLNYKGLKSILVVPNPQIAPSQKEVRTHCRHDNTSSGYKRCLKG